MALLAEEASVALPTAQFAASGVESACCRSISSGCTTALRACAQSLGPRDCTRSIHMRSFNREACCKGVPYCPREYCGRSNARPLFTSHCPISMRHRRRYPSKHTSANRLPYTSCRGVQNQAFETDHLAAFEVPSALAVVDEARAGVHSGGTPLPTAG